MTSEIIVKICKPYLYIFGHHKYGPHIWCMLRVVYTNWEHFYQRCVLEGLVNMSVITNFCQTLENKVQEE